MTRAEALAIVAKEEDRRRKKREYFNKWRRENRERYNAYIREWRARKRAVAEPSAVSIKRTTIDIDEAKFAQVRQALGTRTLRETVDRSFDEVLARAARERSIQRLQRMEGLDLDKPDVMRAAWR